MAQLLPDCRLNYYWIGGSPNTGLPAQRMAEYSGRDQSGKIFGADGRKENDDPERSTSVLRKIWL